MSRRLPQTGPSSGEASASTLFILLLAGLMTVAAMSTDINLPALPVIAESFAAPTSRAQLTITAFFAGFGVGQLMVGPLSDRFGRRPVMLGGLAFFVLTSLGCALACEIWGLIGWRTLQGLAAACGPVLARAVVRDLFAGPQMACLLSLATAAFIIAPIFAPSIGALLLELGSWRWIFIFLAVYGLILLAIAGRWLEESLREPDPTALSPRRFAASLWAVLSQPLSRRYTAVLVATFTVLVVYLAGSPLLFMQAYGLDGRSFGLIFALIALASAAGNLANAWLAQRRPLEQLVWLALAGGSMAMSAATVSVLAGAAPLPVLVGLFACAFFCFSSAMANATTLAMQPHARIVGTASSILGVLQTVIPALLASLLAAFGGGGPVAITASMALAFGVGLIVAWPRGRRCGRLGVRPPP